MAVKLADPGELRRAPRLYILVFLDQKAPLLQVVALNRPIIAVVAHAGMLLSGIPAINELSNLYSNERRTDYGRSGSIGLEPDVAAPRRSAIKFFDARKNRSCG